MVLRILQYNYNDNIKMSKFTKLLSDVLKGIKDFLITFKGQIQAIKKEIYNIAWSNRQQILKYLWQFLVVTTISIFILFLMDSTIIYVLKLLF